MQNIQEQKRIFKTKSCTIDQRRGLRICVHNSFTKKSHEFIVYQMKKQYVLLVVFSLLSYVFSRLKLTETSHGVLFHKIVACESLILDSRSISYKRSLKRLNKMNLHLNEFFHRKYIFSKVLLFNWLSCCSFPFSQNISPFKPEKNLRFKNYLRIQGCHSVLKQSW